MIQDENVWMKLILDEFYRMEKEKHDTN